MALSLAWIPCVVVDAADFFWTNNTVNGNFTNAANWFTNGVPATTFPGATDSANFTNLASTTVNWTSGVTNENAFFNSATNTTATLNVSNSTWLLNTSLVVGQNAGSTATVSQSSGTIIVTNGSGTGAFVVGQAGRGAYTLAGGTLTVDQLYATNVVVGATNSFLALKSGTLNILNGSTIVVTNDPSANVISTLGGGGTVFLNIQGGTNIIVAPGSAFTFGKASGDRAVVTVSGPSTLWSNTATTFNLGLVGGQNQLMISNGAHVVSLVSSISADLPGASQGNIATVTGSNSVWDVSGFLHLGARAANNQLIITNGGVVNSTGGNIARIGSLANTNNRVLVSGPNSRWNNGGLLLVGAANGGASFNSLTISNGGVVTNTTTSIGGNTGGAGNGVSNFVFVTDPGSLLAMNGDLIVGYAGSNSYMIVSNGGVVSNGGNGLVGRDVASSLTAGNSVLVTGGGSLWQVGGNIYFGSNGVTRGTAASIVVEDGGTIESSGFVGGFFGTGSVTNQGGIYQFTKINLTNTPNTANTVVIDSGTISFRGVTNANIFGNSTGSQLTNMTFLGDNTFRLNGSSNAAGVAGYTLATGNPTNYAGLELVNNSTLWRSTTLTVGGTGRLLVSNTTATIAAALTSAGSIDVVNSKLTLVSNAVISGGFRSDPSTNTFLANATLTASGYLSGSNGDLFVFERNLINQSASNTLFDLQFASVLFTNGAGIHILESPGMDNGDSFAGIGSVTDNFAFGLLTLSAVDSLRVTGTVGSALYVGALDFGGLSNTNNLFLDINLYYDSTLAANSYLAGQSYDLQGNGFLLPYPGAVIPEPSVLGLLLMAALGFASRRRSNNSSQQ